MDLPAARSPTAPRRFAPGGRYAAGREVATDADFARYRADPELLALADVRARCVLHTELHPATDGPRY